MISNLIFTPSKMNFKIKKTSFEVKMRKRSSIYQQNRVSQRTSFHSVKQRIKINRENIHR